MSVPLHHVKIILPRCSCPQIPCHRCGLQIMVYVFHSIWPLSCESTDRFSSKYGHPIKMNLHLELGTLKKEVGMDGISSFILQLDYFDSIQQAIHCNVSDNITE